MPNRKPSRLPVLLSVLGGLEIVAGASLNLFPQLPAWISYGLIAIGVATIIGALIQYRRDLHSWKTAVDNEKVHYSKQGKTTYIRESAILEPENAWIDFSPTNFQINNGHNVASVTDIGSDNYQITFAMPLPSDNYSVAPLNSTPRDFEVVSATSDSAHIRFKGGIDPERVSLRFEWSGDEPKRSKLIFPDKKVYKSGDLGDL